MDAIVTRVQAMRDAGADHVCVQVIRADDDVPRADWRELAGPVAVAGPRRPHIFSSNANSRRVEAQIRIEGPAPTRRVEYFSATAPIG